jgi:hypothetical protein
MTYTFKLARRLAVSRNFAMLAILAIVAACAGDTATGPENGESLPLRAAVLNVSPRTVTAEVNQSVQFRGRSGSPRGDVVTTTWSTTGGSITANGVFSSATAGTFKVIGRGRGWKHTDTAIVVVVPPTPEIARIEVSPDAVTLDTSASRTFSATAYLADGSTATVGLAWTASGGDIDAAGAYTAGTSAGTFRVIAANTAGTLADTAIVILEAPTPAPAPTPPPTLNAVYVTPASVSLAGGGNQKFEAYGRNSVGDSVPVAVTFSATGGTVTSSGLYTAGNTGGTFRVVAKEPNTGKADTSAVTLVPSAPSSTVTGVPFGPFGLWASNTSTKSGPAPFTASIGSSDPSGIVTQIATARTMGQKLVLFMTGGGHDQYLTNGAFDFAKWKAHLDRFNTATIRNAVALGVADGTVVGNALMDEPEHKSWGGVMTRPLLDQMAAYAKQYFPTLPMGVNFGSLAGVKWRTNERFHVVDYTLNQYAWNDTKGDVAAYRKLVLDRAALDGTTTAFSLSILDGGIKQDGCFSGSACCPQPETEGVGTLVGAGGQNCRATASQVATWGRALGPLGCFLVMWKYDVAFMGRADNQQAFRDVASALATAPRKSCNRP